jgi:nucleoside-diphosphate-sugar epimerase
VARVLAKAVEGIAKARGAKRAPLINKARYKFLGLNLDFSIEKARRVLGYAPPFTTDQGLTAALADSKP